MIRSRAGRVEETLFPKGKHAPCDLERWAGRPSGKAGGAGYLLPTGRCEPRRPVPGLEARGEQWGEPVATTPRAAGLSPLTRRSAFAGEPLVPPRAPSFREASGAQALNLPATRCFGRCSLSPW